MITKINDLPDHTVGFSASAKVTKHDYDTILLPAVKELAGRTGSIYYLFVIDTELGDFSPGAWWDDIKVGLQHFTQWKKIAIVTHNKNIEKVSDIFSFAIPGRIKGFDMAHLEEAKQWISEK